MASRGAAPRRGLGRSVARWRASLAAVFALAAVVAFAPGLRAPFVSDTFFFIEVVRTASWSDAARWFIPAEGRFYRPLYLVTLWTAHRIFGADALG